MRPRPKGNACGGDTPQRSGRKILEKVRIQPAFPEPSSGGHPRVPGRTHQRQSGVTLAPYWYLFSATVIPMSRRPLILPTRGVQ